VVKETTTDWQQRLDQEGTVVIKSRQQTAMWILLGCVAVAVLGLALLASGSIGGAVAGVVLLGSSLYGLYRSALSIRKGEPQLLVTTDRLEYRGRSVPWTAVQEVVRHTRTMRGDTTTYVWILYGRRERLRLPTTLVADPWELGGWLGSVHSRYCEVP
jgi:hypothetical protein